MNHQLTIKFVSAEKAKEIKENIEWHFEQNRSSDSVSLTRRGRILRILAVDEDSARFIGYTWCFWPFVEKFLYKLKK